MACRSGAGPPSGFGPAAQCKLAERKFRVNSVDPYFGPFCVRPICRRSTRWRRNSIATVISPTRRSERTLETRSHPGCGRWRLLGGSEDFDSLESGRGIKVVYPDGSVECKDRRTLVTSGNFFVKASDPALGREEWEVYSDCSTAVKPPGFGPFRLRFPATRVHSWSCSSPRPHSPLAPK